MSTDQQQSKKKINARIVAVLATGQLGLGFLTLRDIQKRGREGVRGPRFVWKAWGTTNTLGSLMYWKFGRREVQLPKGD